MSRAPAVFALSLVLVLSPAVTIAVTVLPGQGVSFNQVDFTWAGSTTLDSSTGQVDVDIVIVQALTGLRTGFVNVSTSLGWVVQNLPLFDGFPSRTISTKFQLSGTSGVDVTSLGAFVDVSSAPVTAFAGGPLTTFPVGNTSFNAQGKGSPVGAGAPAPPPPGAVTFIPAGPLEVCVQPDHQNVQAANNQCGPAAAANSLQWLEDTCGIVVPHDNIPGLLGVPPNSLVGQLDLTMTRAAISRASGSPISDGQFLTGKLTYLSTHGLGYLVVQHQDDGTAFGDPGAGSFTAAGMTSLGQGPAPTAGFIIDEVCHNEDVELGYTQPSPPGGGHWVQLIGAGQILGVPWVAYKSDHLQTDGDPTDTLGVDSTDFSYLVDTGDANPLLNLVDEATVPDADIVVSESTPAIVLASCGGVLFSQIDFTWPGATTFNSTLGQLDVDVPGVLTASGLSAGFLNVVTPLGWVVQNLAITKGYSYPTLSTRFQLSTVSGVDVTSVDALVVITCGPLTIAPTGATTTCPVGDTEHNAQGVDGPVVGPPLTCPPPPGGFSFPRDRAGRACEQRNHQNVQAANNQCVPASVANSFQWLEDTWCITVPHDNVPGLRGVPANSLVGQLDLTMGRAAASRTVGAGTDPFPALMGKLNYLRTNGLGDTVVKHQGIIGDVFEGPPGGTIRSRDNGALVTADFILDEVCANEDVELLYLYPGGGGHAIEIVGAGVTGGRPWIKYVSDKVQTDRDAGDVLGTGDVDMSYLADTDGDGRLNLVNEATCPTAAVAFSESPPRDTCPRDSSNCHAPRTRPEDFCPEGTGGNAIASNRDHFQCYEIKPAPFTPIPGVSLVDQFGAATADVARPERLCAPADKNDENPDAPSHPPHLVGYRVRHPFVRLESQEVVNQFGTVLLDVVKPDRLMAPSAKGLAFPPPPLIDSHLDHFQCYRIRRTHGSPPFAPIPGVQVRDQFGTTTVTLRRPVRLCAPVNKNDEDPGAPNHLDHQLCYRTSHTTFGTQDVSVRNQFGVQTVTLIRREELCVPSSKNPSSTSTTTTTATSTTSTTS